MPETEEAPEVVDARLKNTKLNRRTAKAALTRAGKALNHLIEGQRPREENDEAFTVEEHWLEECQETFMNLETNAKLYIESKLESNVEQSSNNVEACTSVTNLEQQMDGETSMQNSDGIPTMHENTSSIVINTSPAAQAPNSVSPVNEHVPADHANEQRQQSASQTCCRELTDKIIILIDY
ncbi:Hypothetical predicted protein [Paramuricea clavata]|uniref:Uncharacterized protein n=1 Tax=Paramuricea clavata TaxID=317549 RepID=A0A7D9JXL5_PARCT|nr:Hypothetical predicted protein [Paramuricea clavata]